MNSVLIVLVLLIVCVALAAAAARASLWLLAGGAALVLLTLVSGGLLPTMLLTLAWLGWLALAASQLQPLRYALLTRPALALYRRKLPAVSETEQAALDAGTVWWDAELFSGSPDWSRLADLPMPALTEAEQAFLDGPVEELCEMLNDWEVNHELNDLPPRAWEFIRSERFFAMIIPERFGGLGFSARAHSDVIMKLTSRCSAAAVTVMVPNSLGPAELLLRYGTEAQQDYYLPRLASGEEIPCFGLTNPLAGSDAASLPDRGVVCRGDYLGEEVLGIRANWEKRYITLGPVATLLGLAFKVEDPDGLLAGSGQPGITVALVPTDLAGIEIGRRHSAGRQAFQNGPNAGSDVFIPMSMVIGGQARCGEGWRMLMNCLAAGRAVSLPASSTGGIKAAARYTGAYARIRRQFGLPIARFEAIGERLAALAADAYQIDAARLVTTAALDAGEEPGVISAMLKYRATETLRSAINNAMDVHAGRAVCDGPANYLVNAYNSVPVAITVEGANILTRSLIVFGQGAIRCHPWLLREIEAVRDDDLAGFDAGLRGHIAFSVTTAARALLRNLGGGLLGSDPSVGELNYWYAQLERAAASFALTADSYLLMLGGDLKRREALSGRFADIFSELYLLSCCLKRFETEGRPIADLPLLEFVMRRGLLRIQQSLGEVLDNPPQPLAGWLLRRVVFPFGRRWRGPSDTLTLRVAETLSQPGLVRDKLTAGVYVDTDPASATGRLEHAWQLTLDVEDIDQRLKAAVKAGRIAATDAAAGLAAGVIDAEEAERHAAAAQAVRHAIDVDDFAPGAFRRAAAQAPDESVPASDAARRPAA